MGLTTGIEYLSFVCYDSFMKYEKIHGFFGTTGFATDIDGLTFPALLELFIQKRYKEQSVGKVVQAY